MLSVERLEIAQFEWDEQKRARTLKERYLDFLDAAEALLSPHLEMPSDRDGELRVLALCQASQRIIAVIYTMRESVCRIISVRPARKNEQAIYRQVFGG